MLILILLLACTFVYGVGGALVYRHQWIKQTKAVLRQKREKEHLSTCEAKLYPYSFEYGEVRCTCERILRNKYYSPVNHAIFWPVTLVAKGVAGLWHYGVNVPTKPILGSVKGWLRPEIQIPDYDHMLAVERECGLGENGVESDTCPFCIDNLTYDTSRQWVMNHHNEPQIANLMWSGPCSMCDRLIFGSDTNKELTEAIGRRGYGQTIPNWRSDQDA